MSAIIRRAAGAVAELRRHVPVDAGLSGGFPLRGRAETQFAKLRPRYGCSFLSIDCFPADLEGAIGNDRCARRDVQRAAMDRAFKRARRYASNHRVRNEGCVGTRCQDWNPRRLAVASRSRRYNRNTCCTGSPLPWLRNRCFVPALRPRPRRAPLLPRQKPWRH